MCVCIVRNTSAFGALSAVGIALLCIYCEVRIPYSVPCSSSLPTLHFFVDTSSASQLLEMIKLINTLHAHTLKNTRRMEGSYDCFCIFRNECSLPVQPFHLVFTWLFVRVESVPLPALPTDKQ